MHWVEVRFVNGGKERWEGLTHDQARSVYEKHVRARSKFQNAWYVRMGDM